MTATKIEGMKDDLDVVAIVKAFEAFKDSIQLVSDKAETMVVELQFESSANKTTHYNFKQDEVIALNGVKINPDNKKISFGVIFGTNDKFFYNDEAELINVTVADDVTSVPVTTPLSEHIKHSFDATFDKELKINSITALQAMVRNNPPLVDILNNPGDFLEKMETTGARGKAYAKLEKFGRY